jgi:hypothetical protein
VTPLSFCRILAFSGFLLISAYHLKKIRRKALSDFLILFVLPAGISTVSLHLYFLENHGKQLTNPPISLIVISLRLHLKKAALSEVSPAIKAARFLCHGPFQAVRHSEK